MLPNDLVTALHGDRVPKFLATLDAQGKPNVVVITSIDALDERTLFFGEFLIWKTRENLGVEPRVAVAVVTEDLALWTLRGRFREFQDRGPLLERLNQKEMFRYNAYLRISRAGVIDVEAVTGTWKLSKLRVAAELLPLKAASLLAGAWPGRALPGRVVEKFARTQAVKFLAFRGEDGYPEIVPAFSLVPTRSATMLFGTGLFAAQMRRIPKGARVAASVLTFDAISYQVKGVYAGQTLGVGRLKVDEVYSASPPLAGERIPFGS
jgi:hypothetical protein